MAHSSGAYFDTVTDTPGVNGFAVRPGSGLPNASSNESALAAYFAALAAEWSHARTGNGLEAYGWFGGA